MKIQKYQCLMNIELCNLLVLGVETAAYLSSQLGNHKYNFLVSLFLFSRHTFTMCARREFHYLFGRKWYIAAVGRALTFFLGTASSTLCARRTQRVFSYPDRVIQSTERERERGAGLFGWEREKSLWTPVNRKKGALCNLRELARASVII